MTLMECLTSAWRSVRSNKLRSALTLLGVVIGVGSVIALLSLGEGAKRDVVKQIQGVGSNLIVVQPNWQNEQVRQGNNRRLSYTDEDIRSILKSCPDVKRIAPQSFTGTMARYGAKAERTTACGVTANYADIRGTELSAGRFFSEMDVTSRRRVAVIGSGIAESLFGLKNPVGQHVKLWGIRFTVIGVIAPKESTTFSMDGSSDDRYIYVPVRTLARFTHDQRYPVIFAQSTTAENTKKAADQMRWYFDRRDGKDVHLVQSQSDLVKMVGSVLAIFTAVLGGIGSISLIVGGIGIMNIMLVSVTERTREIGIRKAVGAKKRDILLQFLIESVVLCLMGGILGILLGSGIAALVSKVSPVTAYVSPFAVILAFASAVFVGLASGVYPAWKAGGLDPIEALRYE